MSDLNEQPKPLRTFHVRTVDHQDIVMKGTQFVSGEDKLTIYNAGFPIAVFAQWQYIIVMPDPPAA